LELCAIIGENSLTITIEDTATAFNPLQYAPPGNLDLPITERKIGGLGVYLAIQNTDKFLYERVDGRNRNIFVMNLPKVNIP
jgi:serine/threonine-protein kinase RsbW